MPMGMSIKNEEVESLARELANRRGVSLTEALRHALQREVARERIAGSHNDRHRRLNDIIASGAALPQLSDASDDEILGYGDIGAPTR